VSDDEGHVDPKAMADTHNFDEALLYDFAKFLTTLALLAIGGVLTITQTGDPKDVKRGVVAIVLGAIAIAGVLAVSAANSIVEEKAGGRKARIKPRLLIKGATGFLGMGAGGFLVMWWNSLG
jgi:hypothetical protein